MANQAFQNMFATVYPVDGSDIRLEKITDKNCLKQLQELVGGYIEVISNKHALAPDPADHRFWMDIAKGDAEAAKNGSKHAKIAWEFFERVKEDGNVVLINENGRIHELAPNKYIPFIVGTFIVVPEEVLG
tara:strand:+ start:272 stop:664 length:393 start_codon:yes stop_codon:yes gene_type:complete